MTLFLEGSRTFYFGADRFCPARHGGRRRRTREKGVSGSFGYVASVSVCRWSGLEGGLKGKGKAPRKNFKLSAEGREMRCEELWDGKAGDSSVHLFGFVWSAKASARRRSTSRLWRIS